jgi:hypothetical protein
MKGNALTYQTSWCHDPEHYNMHPYHAENYKPYVCWSRLHWTNQTLLINCSEKNKSKPKHMYHTNDKNDETLDEFSIMMATLNEGWLQITGTEIFMAKLLTISKIFGITLWCCIPEEQLARWLSKEQGDSVMSKVIYNVSMFFRVWHCEMDVLKKQCSCIKCYLDLHKTEEKALSPSKTYD